MNRSRFLPLTFLAAALPAAAPAPLLAFCDSSVETYAIFQCSDRAYFAPVPLPFAPTDVTTLFWQLGFGSAVRSTGSGTDGTGVGSKADFNGNDSGFFQVDLVDAAAAFPGFPFPPGSVCLGSNNWANFGVDGCCDNARTLGLFTYENPYAGFGPGGYPSNDNILNPYFGYYLRANGYEGYYAIASMMDYPTAVLLRTPGDGWFALAAVTSMERGNTHAAENGPCASQNPGGGSPGSNPAPCDIRQGYFSLQDVTNGSTNAMTGLHNVIEWQASPRPRLTCLAGCSGEGPRQIAMEVDPVRFHHDGRSVPSNNPTMATRNPSLPRDPTRSGGAGVVDLLRRWEGLIHYTIESASVGWTGLPEDPADLIFAPIPGLTSLAGPIDANGEPIGPLSVTFESAGDVCFRAVVHIGTVPEVSGASTTAANCRVGKCGDVGFELRPITWAGIQCLGGVLLGEGFADAAIANARGVYTLSWSTTSELSVQGFDVFALTRRGEQRVADVACKECTTSLPGSYEVGISRGDLRGGAVEAFRIRMRGGNGDEVTLDASDQGGRGAGRRHAFFGR